MKIFVIADPETYLAFALAGINGQSVHSEEEVPLILENLNRTEIGLVLITEVLAEKNRQAIEGILLEPAGPLILEIPGVRGPKHKKPKVSDQIFSLLRR
jgi:V/A-type H+-transporting ATPase subunit F